MDGSAPPAGRKDKAVLLIGQDDLADETERALEADGVDVKRLTGEDESEVREAIERGAPDTVAIVARSDAIVLRHALLARSLDEEVGLLLTIFDATMADYVSREIENAHVTSVADIVAPSLAGPCIDERFTAVDLDHDPPVALIDDGDDLREERIDVGRSNWVAGLFRAFATPYDRSAALLLYGAVGLGLILVVETVMSMIVVDAKPVDAFYKSAKALVTVGPNDAVEKGPGWFKVFIAVTVLLAFVFAAAFTAGLINRVIDRRLTGVLGARSVPRRGHVVVVGLGQVGLRLCLVLRRCGVPVVAVEQGDDGENVGMARKLNLPVVIGRGADPSILERLSLKHARAVAAVTADDLQNIQIAMAAQSVHPDVRVVLRVGDGQVANETRSLLSLGVVRDVHRIAGALLAAMATTGDAESVVCLGDDAHVRFADGRLERAEIDVLAS